ncbi:hypothetical protein [Pediococcus acidilactici]|uniref:hypothetical protein n=1 Tax=Pediococcus acidilactici TaxID=1254 RepID=UPI00190FAC43|nr:hypothetical protein [Pediococcus acidilactici]
MDWRRKIREILLFALITTGMSWWMADFFPHQFQFNWGIIVVVNLMFAIAVLTRKR